MSALATKRRSFVVFIASLLLTMQVAGFHLHFCMDGQSPPVQLHLVDDVAGAPAFNGGQPHVDKVLALASDPAIRDATLDQDLPSVLPVELRWKPPILATHVVAFVLPATSVQPLTRSHFLPPLRGPPTARA